MPSKENDPIYQGFLREKARLWREEHIRLSEKDYLDAIDPTRTHSVSAAKNYIEKLRTGAWRSNTVRARVEDTNEAAGLYNVIYADRAGNIVTSANVQVPLNRSLLDAYSSGDLRAAGDKYIERRYEEEKYQNTKQRRLKGIESDLRKNTRGLKIVGIRRMERSYKTVEIVRRRKK